MLVLSMVSYFILACVFVWYAAFAEGRTAVDNALSVIGKRIARRLLNERSRLFTTASSLRTLLQSGCDNCVGIIRRHSWSSALVLLIVLLPSAIAIVAGRHARLDGYDSTGYEVNDQIAALLKGEQLVAPTPLPPEFFLTKEVLEDRPLLGDASRNWELLNADFRQRLLLVFKLMRERHGYEMAIIEGYRSPERQNMLAALGPAVTNAKAFQSYHQFGLAADCAFVRGGKLVISERDPWAMRGYDLYGETAASVGLTWGGGWKMRDFGHVELRMPNGLTK